MAFSKGVSLSAVAGGPGRAFVASLRAQREPAAFQPVRLSPPKANAVGLHAILFSQTVMAATATRNGMKSKTLINVQYKNVAALARRARRCLADKLGALGPEACAQLFPLAGAGLAAPALAALLEASFGAPERAPAGAPLAQWLAAAADLADMPFVAAGPAAIRFARSLPLDAKDETSWQALPAHDARYHIAENQLGVLSTFGAVRAEALKVVELLNFGFNGTLKDGAATPDLFYANIGDVAELAAVLAENRLPLADRLRVFVDLDRQCWRLPVGDKTLDNFFVAMRVDRDTRAGLRDAAAAEAELEITAAPRVSVVPHFVGYDASDKTLRENTPEAFAFQPAAGSGETPTQQLRAQLSVVQYGPALGGDLDQREYYGQFLVHVSVPREMCYASGISRVATWVRHMQANPVPFIGVFSPNADKTLEKLAGSFADRSDPGFVADIQTYCKLVGWQLREWLTQRCVPVSAEWVHEHFGRKPYISNAKPEKIVFRERDGTVPTLMISNQMNLDERTQVLNLSEHQFAWEELLAAGWTRFAVSVAEVTNAQRHEARLPDALAQLAAWPATPAAGDAALAPLKAYAAAMDYVVFAHKFEAGAPALAPHPVYASGAVPPDAEPAAAAADDDATTAAEADAGRAAAGDDVSESADDDSDARGHKRPRPHDDPDAAAASVATPKKRGRKK